MRTKRLFLAGPVLSLGVVASLLAPETAKAQSAFIPLGDLPGDPFVSLAAGVSGDGLVVVGYGTTSEGMEAFRWTLGGGMVGLGNLPGGLPGSQARGTNSDGSVVVGFGTTAGGYEAFRWTQGGGMIGLGHLDGGETFSVAHAVSADGLVVVGQSDSSNGAAEAFRWTQTGGMVGLGDLPGGDFSSIAFAVNADGTVVVGHGSTAVASEAFRWTQGGGMVGLGFLPGGASSSARGVSADGSVIVGLGNSTNGVAEAFRWTQTGGMVGLGDLPGGSFFSAAYAVNANGNVVVGGSDGANGMEAFRWTTSGGLQTVTGWLSQHGVAVAPEYFLATATGVSADGNVVVGWGSNSNGMEAWLARISSTGSGVLTLDGSLIASLSSTSLPVDGAIEHANLVLNGAHHRPLMDSAIPEGTFFSWASGDLGSYGFDRNFNIGVAEVGAGAHLVPQRLTAGLGVGTSFINQGTIFGGRSDLDGQHILGEIDFRPTGLGANLLFSVTGLYADWDASVRRGYINAGLPDHSTGATDLSDAALRARVDWLDAWKLGNVRFSPRAQASWVRAEMDGYTETGGGFPGRFDDRDHTSKEMRYGLRASSSAGPETVLHVDVEGVHRFDDSRAGVSGELLGLFDFDVKGQTISRDWARFGLEMDRRLNPNWSMSISGHAATWGQDPEISGGISLKAAW